MDRLGLARAEVEQRLLAMDFSHDVIADVMVGAVLPEPVERRLTVTVSFHFNIGPGGADGISVAVPDGFIAIPELLVVAEGYSGTVLIYHAGMM